MSKAYRCDICGEFYTYAQREREPGRDYSVENHYRSYSTTLDICPKCYKELVNWIEGGKENEDQSNNTGDTIDSCSGRGSSNDVYGSEGDTGSGEAKERS